MKYKLVNIEKNIIRLMNIFLVLIMLVGIIDLIISKSLNISILNMWPEIFFIIFIFPCYILLLTKKRTSKKVWLGISLMLLFLIIQFFIACEKTSTLQYIFGYKVILFYVPIYFIFYFIEQEHCQINSNAIVKIISILSILMFLIGVLQLFIGYENLLNIYGEDIKNFTNKGILRVFSTTKSPFEYGWCCVISILLCTSYIIFNSKKNKLVNISLICSVLGLIISNARESMVNVIIGLLTICLMRILINLKIGKKVIYIYMIILPILGFGIFILINKISILDIYTNNQLINSLIAGGSIKERLLVWEDAINMYDMNNIISVLFGNGIGSIGSAQGMMNKFGYNIIANPVDNMYLYLYLNTGIIGLVSFILFIYMNIKVILFNLNYTKNMYLQIAILSIVSTVLIGGYFRTVIEGLTIQVLLMYLLGVGYRLSKNNY